MKKMKKLWSDLVDGKGVSRKTQALVLPILVLVGASAVGVAVIAIIVAPHFNPASQRGVGANGFQAFIEEKSNLGVDKIVFKKDVEEVLGKKAKVVSNVQLSKVFNLDGNRGQTATYNFVRSDGTDATVYIDVMIFKDQIAFDAAHVTQATVETSKIQGNPAYYLAAQTLGSEREYRLMVLNGLKVYKFVVTQPYRNITISEVAALAAMKKLALKANF